MGRGSCESEEEVNVNRCGVVSMGTSISSSWSGDLVLDFVSTGLIFWCRKVSENEEINLIFPTNWYVTRCWVPKVGLGMNKWERPGFGPK